ncbi:hypothetical protein OGATHE_002062 [Ogataea polymorpha]|uniref:Uncharacterized protein n=1 Tax=Ogataea polymorpha TaxID=460523 RepID=A0A9P8PMB0_9ASCO|nr:hypothetical protein OGATHE_002062 [Ogataea polymorpha]
MKVCAQIMPFQKSIGLLSSYMHSQKTVAPPQAKTMLFIPPIRSESEPGATACLTISRVFHHGDDTNSHVHPDSGIGDVSETAQSLDLAKNHTQKCPNQHLNTETQRVVTTVRDEHLGQSLSGRQHDQTNVHDHLDKLQQGRWVAEPCSNGSSGQIGESPNRIVVGVQFAETVVQNVPSKSCKNTEDDV